MVIEVTEKVGAAFVTMWGERVMRGEAIPEAEKVRLLVTNNNGTYTAIDNSTGQCYIEDFKIKNDAIGWLMGEFEL